MKKKKLMKIADKMLAKLAKGSVVIPKGAKALGLSALFAFLLNCGLYGDRCGEEIDCYENLDNSYSSSEPVSMSSAIEYWSSSSEQEKSSDAKSSSSSEQEKSSDAKSSSSSAKASSSSIWEQVVSSSSKEEKPSSSSSEKLSSSSITEEQKSSSSKAVIDIDKEDGGYKIKLDPPAKEPETKPEVDPSSSSKGIIDIG